MLRMTTVLLAIIACVPFLAACSATMHTTDSGDAYVYERPELASIEKAPLDQVWRATQDAMKDLEFAVDSMKKDALQAQLNAEQATGSDVRVALQKIGDNSTRVRIKVGAFGDRGVSELVLTKLRNRIKNPLPESGGAPSEGK